MIVVTENQIPVEDTITSLRSPDCGAVMSYLGTVRSFLEDKQSRGLSFEVEDDVMQSSLEEVERETLDQYDIRQFSIVHRTGSFDIGDDILLIAISSAHRGPAFDACQFAIDRIKYFHESWKQEELHD